MFGEEGFAAPVLLSGRWENRQDQAITPSGQEFVSKAFVYTDEKLALEGYVALGDFTGQANPHLIDEAEQVKGITEIPSLRTNTLVRTAIL